MSVSENTTSPTNQPAGYLELPTLVESAEVDLTATTAANLNDNLTPENNEDVTTSLLEVNQTKETKTTLSPPVSRNGRDLTMRISLPAKLDHPDHPVCDKGARGRVSSGAALESSKSESNSSTRHRAITRIWSNFSRASSASKNQGGTNSLNRQHSTTSSTFRLLSSERSSQIRLAAMLFVVTLVFLLAYLPALIVNTALSNQGDAWNRFIFYIYFVNNAANPLIYGIMNKQFRSEMLKAYFRC